MLRNTISCILRTIVSRILIGRVHILLQILFSKRNNYTQVFYLSAFRGFVAMTEVNEMRQRTSMLLS